MQSQANTVLWVAVILATCTAFFAINAAGIADLSWWLILAPLWGTVSLIGALVLVGAIGALVEGPPETDCEDVHPQG